MSVHVISWVLKHSPAKLGARLVLIVLADHASHDGTGAWASVPTLAEEARLSVRATRTALRRLEQDGAIEATGHTAYGTTIYTVLMGAADSAGRQIPTENVSSSSAKPSLNGSSYNNTMSSTGSSGDEGHGFERTAA